MLNRYAFAATRIFFAVLGLSAVITEIAVLNDRGLFMPANFFSFFTIESNLFAAFVLILGAFAAASGKQNKRLAMLRGAATVYMAITGIVFAVLLSGIENATLTAVPWDNIVLHYIMPAVLVIDWFVALPSTPIKFNRALAWLAFPIAYVAYSLTRGHFVAWYPYPFLDPAQHSYTAIAATSASIALLSVVIIWFLAYSTKWGRTRKA